MEKTYANRLAEILRTSGETEYYRLLGEFVNQFAQTEADLQSALQYFSKTKPDIARAIFSGTKIDVGVSFIKRILEVKPLRARRKQAAIIDALDQLKAINDVRNHVLHYGSKWQDGETWLVTNARSAHAARALKEIRVTKPMLRAMVIDLMKIDLTIADVMAPRYLGKELRARLRRAVNDTWSYKRPGQAPAGRAKKGSRKERPRSKRPRQPKPQGSAAQ